MSYATADDIELRYPGELAQAGPRDAAGNLDDDAIAAALATADQLIDLHLGTAGRTVPLEAPYPAWVVDVAVDLALYLATPTALASQGDFADRYQRYQDAYRRLQAIAAGQLLPPGTGLACAAYAPDRLFSADTLEGF